MKFKIDNQVEFKDNSLILTTGKPGFMGAVSEPLVTIPDAKPATKSEELKGTRAYLHGKLQDIAGYDIPIFLQGDMVQLDNIISEQSIIAMLPTGNYSCYAILQGENSGDSNAYYIVLKEEWEYKNVEVVMGMTAEDIDEE